MYKGGYGEDMFTCLVGLLSLTVTPLIKILLFFGVSAKDFLWKDVRIKEDGILIIKICLLECGLISTDLYIVL